MALDKADHGALVLWAAECAEHVLPSFEVRHPSDGRPRRALEAARAWVRGEMSLAEVRAAAFDAHAAARVADHAAARAAARAAGHAAATAHVATHAAHAATYASKAAAAMDDATDTEERAWQLRRLPTHLRPVASPGRTTDDLDEIAVRTCRRPARLQPPRRSARPSDPGSHG